MLTYNVKDLTVPEVHKLLLGGVAPRPIALVSTLSKEGIPNLSPFSFFGVFGANPPIVAFSPSRRGRTATLKDTYHNIKETEECVINSVTYSMVHKINVASAEFSSEINEFEKSGLTPVKSDLIKPFRVNESPFQMECKLVDLRSYGEGGTSANMAICEVLIIHVAEEVFLNGIINPNYIDLVGRMSGDYYARINGEMIFELPKPISNRIIGYDSLPEQIKYSSILSANDIGKLSSVESIPDYYDAKKFISDNTPESPITFEIESFNRLARIKDYKKMLLFALNYNSDKEKQKNYLELTAKTALDNNDVVSAWNILKYIIGK